MFLPRELTITGECYINEACTILTYFLPQSISISEKNNDEAVIRIHKTELFEQEPEKYRIVIRANENVYIEYSEYLGLRNALAVFSQMVRLEGMQFYVEEGVTESAPILAHRGVMLDLARGIKDFDVLLEDVVFIAKCRMNRLHLHLFDEAGLCFYMDSVPDSCCIANAYTKEQMKELCTLANLLGLEVIPEFDMPAHATHLLECMPILQCQVDAEVSKVPWVVCAGSEATYQFYENVIREIAEVFPGKYIHVGGDELEFSDLPEPLLCHWEDCEQCKALCERAKLTDITDMYYYFMSRIDGMIKKEGRRMIMWSDQIDCARPVNIPKDVIMHFWRVAVPGRGPVEGCSMQRLLELGFEVINSTHRETYLVEERYMSAETIRDWRWDRRPECDEKFAGQIIGSEICFWEYGNKQYSFYERVLYPAVALMADKLWNGKDLEYTKEYSKMLTRLILGAGVPDKLDLFACLGSVMPPRNSNYAYYEKVECTEKELQESIHMLECELYEKGDAMRAEIYCNCIKQVRRTLYN